jgi:hypothetical protein
MENRMTDSIAVLVAQVIKQIQMMMPTFSQPETLINLLL